MDSKPPAGFVAAPKAAAAPNKATPEVSEAKSLEPPPAAAAHEKQESVPSNAPRTGPSGLSRCADLLPRLGLEVDTEKRVKALQKKFRDIEKLKEKRATEAVLEKLQEEKIAKEPPRAVQRPANKPMKKKEPEEDKKEEPEENEEAIEAAKSVSRAPAALKTKRQLQQQAATSSVHTAESEDVVMDPSCALWQEVKDVAASGSGGTDKGRQKHALTVHQAKAVEPYNVFDKYIWKLGFVTRLELKLPPGMLSREDFQEHFPGGMMDLLEVILKENALTALPPRLGLLPRLRYLDVSNNLLEELPGEETWVRFAGCLENLDLAFNRLTSIAPLAPLTKLSSLKVDGNRLTSLEGVSWSNLKQLHTLTAMGNQISELSAEVEAVGESLQHLELSDNKFSLLYSIK